MAVTDEHEELRDRVERLELQVRLLSAGLGLSAPDPAAAVPADALELARQGDDVQAIRRLRTISTMSLTQARALVLAARGEPGPHPVGGLLDLAGPGAWADLLKVFAFTVVVLIVIGALRGGPLLSETALISLPLAFAVLALALYAIRRGHRPPRGS